MARISTTDATFWMVRSGAAGLEVRHWRFASPQSLGGWQPLVNAFRCADSLQVCVELAGVERSQIDLQVEPRRLIIRGTRAAPEPPVEKGPPRQILAMEIDYGGFARELVLPSEVEVTAVTAHQREGLLWIELPLRH